MYYIKNNFLKIKKYYFNIILTKKYFLKNTTTFLKTLKKIHQRFKKVFFFLKNNTKRIFLVFFIRLVGLDGTQSIRTCRDGL